MSQKDIYQKFRTKNPKETPININYDNRNAHLLRHRININDIINKEKTMSILNSSPTGKVSQREIIGSTRPSNI